MRRVICSPPSTTPGSISSTVSPSRRLPSCTRRSAVAATNGLDRLAMRKCAPGSTGVPRSRSATPATPFQASEPPSFRSTSSATAPLEPCAITSLSACWSSIRRSALMSGGSGGGLARTPVEPVASSSPQETLTATITAAATSAAAPPVAAHLLKSIPAEWKHGTPVLANRSAGKSPCFHGAAARSAPVRGSRSGTAPGLGPDRLGRVPPVHRPHRSGEHRQQRGEHRGARSETDAIHRQVRQGSGGEEVVEERQRGLPDQVALPAEQPDHRGGGHHVVHGDHVARGAAHRLHRDHGL